jgi:signal transduction histidine kinase
VVAIAVNPLRVGLQRSVNRLLYGDRDDPYAALSRVAEQLTAVARHRVLPAVAAEVSRAMRVPYVCIEWWTDLQRPAVVQVGNPPADETDCYDVPLSYRGEHLGRLLVAARAAGERFAPAERRLLSDLARQVGAAIHDESLSAELQRSRERIVLAREEERRELRRTLHDDIGPTIASIALRAETVRQLADRPQEREPMSNALDAIGHDATAAARALRLLSYELRPPALDDRGLVLALRDQAPSLAPLTVEVNTVGLEDPERDAGNLPAAVEVAAFRIVISALNNTAHHAGAVHSWVRLVREGGRLTVEIDDDGTGLPVDFRAGVGITAMRERAAELGGDCTHETRPGGGTRVRARLPIGGAE